MNELPTTEELVRIILRLRFVIHTCDGLYMSNEWKTDRDEIMEDSHKLLSNPALNDVYDVLESINEDYRMTDKKLKSCPFCGKIPVLIPNNGCDPDYPHDVLFVQHPENSKCLLSMMEFLKTERNELLWNMRAIEIL